MNARSVSTPCLLATTRRAWPITPLGSACRRRSVMPRHTPLTKVARTRGHGARLEGVNLSESLAVAERLAKEEGLVFIHPFDDPRVIEGQGTLGLELLAQVRNLDAVVVPIGGGGLISGVAIAIKAARRANHGRSKTTIVPMPKLFETIVDDVLTARAMPFDAWHKLWPDPFTAMAIPAGRGRETRCTQIGIDTARTLAEQSCHEAGCTIRNRALYIESNRSTKQLSYRCARRG